MAKAPAKTRKQIKPPSGDEICVESIKGFDQNLCCRGFQFELGKTYEHDGKVVACESGFHAIEGHPLEVFAYYPPASNRYALVTQSGEISRHGDDSKIASAKITIGVELHLHDLAQRAVKWVFERAKWVDGPVATGESEAATASGYQGAATASGYQGAATASGYAGKVRGAEGNALFLVYRETWDGPILHVWAGISGCDGIKPNTWYSLDASGKPVEVA